MAAGFSETGGFDVWALPLGGMFVTENSLGGRAIAGGKGLIGIFYFKEEGSCTLECCLKTRIAIKR